MVAALLAPAARAQEVDASVALVSQAAWVGPGGDLSLRIDLEAPPELELAVVVYPRLTSRASFQASIDPERSRLPGPVGVIASVVGTLTADADGATTISVPVERFGLFRAGVYPVRVLVRERGGEGIAGFTTHLTFAPDPAADRPLKLGLVLPVHDAPSLAADGSDAKLAPRALARIEAVTAALAEHPEADVTMLPTPETIDALAATDPAALDALIAAVGDRRAIASTYVPTSVPALLAAGLEEETTAQLTTGVERLRGGWRSDPETRTWIAVERLDDAALARLREQRIERVVVASSSLASSSNASSGAGLRPFALEARQARRLPALAADDDLAAHLDAGENAALAAQRFLAEAAVIATTTPTRRDGDLATVAVVPRTWTGAGIGALLDGLDGHPLTELTTLDALYDLPSDVARNGTPVVRRLADADPPTVSGGAVRGARERLASFTTVVPEGTPLVEQLDRALLVAQSADLRTARARSRWIQGVHGAIDDVLDDVRIPSRRSITVTARRGDVPIAIQSRSTLPLRAVVELDSGSLDFPAGTTREVHLDRINTSTRFVVRARSSGTFPMRVRLLSPDGRLELAESRLIVRSTAFSGVGVVLSAGAALFLVLWWGRHVRRGRRARRLVPINE